jgi:hypothetical protein
MLPLLVRIHRFGFSPGDQTQQDGRWKLDDASKKEHDAVVGIGNKLRQDFRLESTITFK